MSTKTTQQVRDRLQQTRVNVMINRRIKTLARKSHSLGTFEGVDVVLIVCKGGRFTTYSSKDHESWPPSMAEINQTYPLPTAYTPENFETKLSPEKPLLCKNLGMDELSDASEQA